MKHKKGKFGTPKSWPWSDLTEHLAKKIAIVVNNTLDNWLYIGSFCIILQQIICFTNHSAMNFYTTTIVALLLFIYCLLRPRKSGSTMKRPPEPSGSWPFIGHLHLIGKLPHIFFSNMADKYGPIYMIKLGVQRALVVNTHNMAKECLSVNDKVFVDRPQSIFVESMAYNSAMFGFTTYGPYWRDIRKIVTDQLLSNHKVEMFKHVRVSELRSSIKDIYDSYCASQKRQTMDMKLWFSDMSMNSMVRLIAGKNLREIYQGKKYDTILKTIREFLELALTFVPADAIPCLRWFDFGGYEKSMKTVSLQVDRILQEWLDEHKKGKYSEKEKAKQDFIDVMLGLYETEDYKPTKFGVDTIIKATCLTLMLGSDPSAVTLTWALSLLLNHKDVMKKAQREIDAIVGKQRQVNESDLNDLPYLNSVLKETLRLYPAGLLAAARLTVEDCTVSDYHVPRGTQLFVNLYKIHRDPDVWENPLEFQPERFLTTHKDYDFRGTNFAFIPFGSGRRMCPGVSLAYKFMMLSLASLLQGFEMSTPANETIDMTEGFGLTNLKTTPLDVILVPRLADNLYNPPETDPSA